MTSSELVNDSVQSLVGLPFSGVGRSLDMGILWFGEIVEWNFDARPGKNLSEFALHVQCPFRVSGGRRVLVGSEDIGVARESEPGDGKTLFDVNAVRLDAILTERRPVVLEASVSEFGDIRLEVESSIVISVFPVTARKVESWRIFRRGGTHLVYSG